MRQRIAVVRGSKEFVRQIKQWNVDAFKNRETVQKYQQEIQTGLNIMDRPDDRNQTNVNHRWEGIRTAKEIAGGLMKNVKSVLKRKMKPGRKCYSRKQGRIVKVIMN
jgi:hypothetical protein